MLCKLLQAVGSFAAFWISTIFTSPTYSLASYLVIRPFPAHPEAFLFLFVVKGSHKDYSTLSYTTLHSFFWMPEHILINLSLGKIRT